eukprot:TRINITY_DN198_c0_g1_i2.p1 TRINITY_DN198_c0_g1~~TRINITY_DN198_c0_g1_i2.p1  ORF type:complete len:121 (-),score=31.79 TRINITY_DN198_c0_g1_i2:99-461(-)
MHGIVIVCSLVDEESIKAILDIWYPRLKDNIENIPVIIIGNKSDIEEPQNNARDKIEEISTHVPTTLMGVFYTSALTGENIDDAFIALSEAAFRHNDNTEGSFKIGPTGRKIQSNDNCGC